MQDTGLNVENVTLRDIENIAHEELTGKSYSTALKELRAELRTGPHYAAATVNHIYLNLDSANDLSIPLTQFLLLHELHHIGFNRRLIARIEAIGANDIRPYIAREFPIWTIEGFAEYGARRIVGHAPKLTNHYTALCSRMQDFAASRGTMGQIADDIIEIYF
jgi:hypothetical protein